MDKDISEVCCLHGGRCVWHLNPRSRWGCLTIVFSVVFKVDSVRAIKQTYYSNYNSYYQLRTHTWYIYIYDTYFGIHIWYTVTRPISVRVGTFHRCRMARHYSRLASSWAKRLESRSRIACYFASSAPSVGKSLTWRHYMLAHSLVLC